MSLNSQPICFRFAGIQQCPVAWHNFDRALAVGQMASHLTLEYFCIQRSSWSIQWLQGSKKGPNYRLQSSWSNVVLCIWSCLPKRNCPQHCKLKLRCHVLFRKKRLSPGNVLGFLLLGRWSVHPSLKLYFLISLIVRAASGYCCVILVMLQ